MPRKRDPKRDKAYEIWKQHNGDITNRSIAEQLEVDEKKVAVWKQRDKWNSNVVQQTNNKKRNVVQQKDNKFKEKQKTVKKDQQILKELNDELTDKQRLFCLYYIKYFNATKAYQKAYDCAYSTAMVEGHRHLRNPKIKAEIDRLKEEQAKGIMLDAQFILQKYIDIAFADITDFVEFGTEEVPGGELEEELTGVDQSYIANYVRFKSDSEVDGSIITEVKKGKDGVSIKLADKMKALDKLWDYFDMMPENIQDQLKVEKLKAETELVKARAETIKGKKKDTSLLEALISAKKGDQS